MMLDGFVTEAVKVDGVTVEGFLVSPADSEAGLVPTDISLPANADVRYRLDVPKTYTKRLRGQKVEIRGGLYDVADKPAYIGGNTPGSWDRYALAYRLEGDWSCEIEVVELVTGIDELGDPSPSERTVFSGAAQARMESGGEDGGDALQTDATETWFFVMPWQADFAGLRPQSTLVRMDGASYDVVSIEDVGRKRETASIKAVRRG